MKGRREMPVQLVISEQKPDYRAGAPRLAEAIRKFYEDPVHEQEYQEWLKERKAR